MSGMRVLLPDPEPAPDLHDFYARDWLDRRGLRMNFVASVDGAATAGGLSRGLQTPGDNQIFAVLRDLADVVLAGAGTVRAENYHAVELSERRAAVRARYGLAPSLPVAVVSASLRLDPASELFAPGPGVPRTIVITCALAAEAERRRLEEVADVIVAGDALVDLASAREQLEARGLTRILCEGGPTLFGDLVRAEQVDELCLSVSPVLAGPGSQRIVGGLPWTGDVRTGLELTGLIEDDSALFYRYRIGR
jgi:riboflavin biosynthesis pyrimidine reductase